MKLLIAFAAFIMACCIFYPKENENLFLPPSCNVGDTIKVCIKSLYWRNGDGIPYAWGNPLPPGTAYGFPMEINFWDHCDSPCGTGGGTQHIFFVNLFEGETYQAEIVVGWGLGYGLAWLAPSVVQGAGGTLGRAGSFAIFDETCTTMLWPSTTTPLLAFPVTQYDCTCSSCPSTPPPDTSNYWYLNGYNQSCKLVLCPI